MQNTNQYTTKSKAKSFGFILPDREVGGSQQVTVLVAEETNRLGYSAELLALTRRPLDQRKAVKSDLPLVTSSATRLLIGMACMLSDLRRFDILFSSLHHVSMLVLLAKKLKLIDARIIVREANSPNQGVLGKYFSYRVYGYVAKWLYGSADLVIASSDWMRSEIYEAYGVHVPVRVVYNPIDLRRVTIKAGSTTRHDFKRRVLSISRLEPQKNVLGLVRKWPSLVRSTELHVYGLGSDEPLIRKATFGAENCYFHGFSRWSELELSNFGCLIIASHWEGFPNSVINALARGLPVVFLNDLPIYEEVLNVFGESWISNISESHGFERSLTKFLDLDRDFTRLHQGLAKYSIEANIRKFIEC
jgi:glycosyltransferase involved in cell wall biosynthesis